ADRVFLDAAVNVVTYQTAVFHLAIATAVVAVGAEGRHLDDLAAEHHVRQTEAATDQPAVAEQVLDLLRRGVGGHVEILGRTADQQVAHGAADQERVEAAVLQSIQDAERIGADLLAGNPVLTALNRARPQRRAG